MRWLKRERWKASLAIACMLLLLILMVWVPVSAAGAYERASGLATPGTGTVQATPTEDATVTALNKEKLAQEVQQLKNQNDRGTSAWFWNAGGLLGTVIAALLAVAGVLATVVINFRQWIGNQTAAQDKDWKDRETEREKRDEERFQKVVEGLGSERTEAKVGAAITLRTFLQPGYERFYRQAFDLAVAHLRLRKAEASSPSPPSSPAHVLIVPKGDLRQEQQPPPPTAPIPLDSLSQALITVFKESFPLARNELKKTNVPFHPQLLDATDAQLDHAYLIGADLAEAWLVGASLRKANLSEAQLKSAYLIGAQLTEAGLSGAQLKSAYLIDAQLEGADLLGAQLKGADLLGAQLEGANLYSAQLEGANLEDADSLKGTKMNGVTGLTPAQREKCIKKGAIFDDGQQAPASDTSSSSSLPSEQSNDTQVPSAPSAQVNTPPPDTGGNGAASSKLGPES